MGRDYVFRWVEVDLAGDVVVKFREPADDLGFGGHSHGPGVGVPTLGSRTTVGREAEAGELITILGVALRGPAGDGRGISDRR